MDRVSPMLLVILLVIVLVAIGYYLSLPSNKSFLKTYHPVDPKAAKNGQRQYGTWRAEKFEYPPVQPFENWDIKTTEPVPYRAFKHKYFVTMGIRSMEWDSWIELDNEWPKYHDYKLARVKERGHELYGTPDMAWDAAIEYLMEFRNYLPKRYPTLFKETPKGIYNLYTGENFEFVDIPKAEFKQDPMLMASLMVQDDLAILFEDENGQYILRSGGIMLAGFWRLRDKINLPLSEIHTHGDVPQYKEKLQKGMEKFFVRLTVDKPVVRNNYFIQTDDNLPWSTSIGEEDNEKVGWYTAEPAKDPLKLYYRSERQSVRRLPKTGAIAFTIRTYFLPVSKMCNEPYVPRRLLNAISSWSEDVRQYRGYDKFYEALLPYLEKRAQEQEAAGLPPEKSNYPL